MTPDNPFLQALLAQPEDDTLRLAMADWLDENGQPERADFVRTQVELARFKPGDPASRPLVLKNNVYFRDFIPAWGAQLPQLPGVEWGDFNRGLIEEVLAEDEEDVVKHASALFAVPGVHVLLLRRLFDARRLTEVPELERLRSLRLVSARTDSVALQVLLASPHLVKLTVLDLHDTGANDAVAADLTDGRFPELAELWLGSNMIGNRGASALANSLHLTKLRRLDLRGNRITDADTRAALKGRFKKVVKL